MEMGKNVKGFSIGDRCVADVGITVSLPQDTKPQELTLLSFITIPWILIDDTINFTFSIDNSAILAFIAVGDSLYSVRTFRLAVSLGMEDSPNTSNSKPSKKAYFQMLIRI